jgi:drug/metabolite transporter (DMT)-like permease
MIIKAYQLGEPSYVSVFEYSEMIFGPLFAWLAFGQPVGGWQVLGIVSLLRRASLSLYGRVNFRREEPA